MTGPAEQFEPHRDHLLAVAYRMLGSRADAEDAVQETWLRWHAADQPEIEDPRAWLTTVTARICLDQLRSARVRREAYVGQWLPEPLVERLPAADRVGPAERAAQTDRVGYALQVVLERLGPEQRVAFVLHDVFAVPFGEIASVLGTTPGAARQLASRARRAVRAGDAPKHTADPAEQRRVVAAFLAAATTGDLDGLLAVLAPDAVTVGDGGGVVPAAPQPIAGAVPVARFVAGLFRRYQREATSAYYELIRIDGDLGVLADLALADGTRLRGTLAFAIAGDRITAVYSQANPAKLGQLPVPDPARAWRG